MNVRQDIRDGDTTTTNGRVIAAVRNDFLDGRAMAYEGDPVWCPQCQTTGKILGVGDRLPEFGPDGRRSALSGDKCLCRCSPSPLLIPSQNRSTMRG